MLARANLLRMRGRWAEAADLCVDVLRLNPNNPTAHSLLGDIYQDQGRPDEAAHWYQLALELNPGSEADRAKLARTDEMLEARRQRAEWEAVIEGRRQPVATSLLVRESLQRIGALAGAGLCGMILVMATLTSLSERTQRGPEQMPAAPGFTPQRHQSSLTVDTRQERYLMRKVSEAAEGGVGQAVGVVVDPRLQTASLRALLPRRVREGTGDAELRILIMREGYRLARALHEVDHSIETIHVTVVSPGAAPDGRPEMDLLLIGTLSAEDLVVRAEVATPEELQKFFTETTPPAWAEELAPR
jgi:tetratricopeptide repeat protein